MTNRYRRIVGPALAIFAIAMLAACQSGSPTAAPPTTTPTAATDQQILAIGRNYSQCVRDHGVPGYPDMVLANGQLALPNTAAADAADQALRANSAAQNACQPILRQLPASAQKNQALSQQDRQNLIQFARCMRQNGVPEWPDPRADGSFAILGTPLAQGNQTRRIGNAEQACRQYWSKGISVK